MNNTHYQATYQLHSSMPDEAFPGEALLLDIELTNTGGIPWNNFGAHPVRLSYHWHTNDNNTNTVVVNDGLRTLLPTPVPPGTRTRVEMRVEAPPTAGQFTLLIDLVEEGFGWFSEKGVAPLHVPIRYMESDKPRATIINGNCMMHDAVGGHVAMQLRMLHAAGYHTLLIVDHYDTRLPDAVLRFTVSAQLADIINPAPDSHMQWVVEHFYASDVVIVHYSTYYELAHLIEHARHSIIFFDYHGVTPPSLWNPNAVGYSNLVLGERYLTLVEHADYASGHSQFTSNELIATGRIPSECVTVMPYGVVDDARYCTHPNAEFIEHYQLAGQRVLLYVGRMARNKRIIDLVEAMPTILHHYPQTVLLLVGENTFGPYAEYAHDVMARAQELGCADHVTFTGQVPQVEPFYGLCDVFVTASIHEGFCMPVVEAMAHGKPVVAAAATALPETVDGGGVLFEPENTRALAESIVYLLNEQTKTIDSETLLATPTSQQSAETMALLRERPIVFVTPRYGADIVGGAERLIRGWAERLASEGYCVEVLTTCVVNMGDWRNHLEPGVEQVNGVTVRRFEIDPVDPMVFHLVQAKAIRGETVAYHEEEAFFANNLQSSALNHYLQDHVNDIVCAIFAPYIFGTAYWGVQAITEKAIVVPCLHDEPAAYFAHVRGMLEVAAGIFFNTQAESDFASETLHLANPYRAVVGYGFDTPAPVGDGAAFRQQHGLPEQVLLYSGRLEEGKNVPLLIDYFTRYKDEYPGELTLLLTGKGAAEMRLPERTDIVAVGILPEETMPNAFAAATVLCQPSLNESFSIVIMEAWLQQRPVLVHARCAVTRSHVEMSNGGDTFDNYESFRDALQRILSDPLHAAELGAHGRDYVLQHYTWEVITERIVRGILAFTQARNGYQQAAQRGIKRALDFTPTRYRDRLLQHITHAQETHDVRLLTPQQQRQLTQLTHVGAPDYHVRSGLPVVGSLVAWVRRQLTSHLKEPYLDPMIQRQEQFNAELLKTVVPALEQSMYEQRRLKREVALMRKRLQDTTGE